MTGHSKFASLFSSSERMCFVVFFVKVFCFLYLGVGGEAPCTSLWISCFYRWSYYKALDLTFINDRVSGCILIFSVRSNPSSCRLHIKSLSKWLPTIYSSSSGTYRKFYVPNLLVTSVPVSSFLRVFLLSVLWNVSFLLDNWTYEQSFW